MTGRRRVLTIVALAAVAAVSATVGVTLLQQRGEHTTVPGAVTKPHAGAPPRLWLDFGVRADPEAKALSRAQTLYDDGHRAQAGAIFARYRSVQAQLGAAFARWPDHSLADVRAIVAAHPTNAEAELHLGWALYWSGRNADAFAAWQQAAALGPDSPAGVDAETALHPTDIPGLPYMLTAVDVPAAVQKLPAAQELRALAAAASKPDATAKLLYGVALWNLKRPLSAERQLKAAAKLAPHDPAARTLAAVGAFSKAAPTRAFSQLGPLTGVFPRAPVVRLHLGLLLLWTGQVDKGKAQLRLAIADGPQTVYGKEARAIVSKLS